MSMRFLVVLASSVWLLVTAVDVHDVGADWALPIPKRNSLSCDLSRVQMPLAPSPLPKPEPGLFLAHVALGRGVQNYTCQNPTANPVSIGAVASLYNASCVAADDLALLSQLPALALQQPVTAVLSVLPPAVDLSGHHFFLNPTTPVFDMNVGHIALGVIVAKKVANSTAPVAFSKNQMGLAVPWLYLEAVTGTTGPIKAVYRLDTAGGTPPATCENSPAHFSVQYAALYWFWSG